MLLFFWNKHLISRRGLVESWGGEDNEVCYTVRPTTMTTQMDIRNATGVTWYKDYSSPSVLLWGENGNNLSISFRGTNHIGEFLLEASNACGSTVKSYIFKSVTCANSLRTMSPTKQSEETVVTMSPNPAVSQVTISTVNNRVIALAGASSGLKISEIRIYDVVGRLENIILELNNKTLMNSLKS